MAAPVHTCESWSGGRLSRDGLLCLAGILLLCLGERLLLILSTDTIAKDGRLYIRMAKEWSTDPAGVVQRYDYPPGYPVALLAVHRVSAVLGVPDDLRGWELAGRIVSLIASLAALAGLWFFATMAFDWRTASLTVLLFGLGRKWAILGMDVLSDALAVALQIWAVVLALVTARLLRRRSRSSLLTAAGVGGCAGLGYLVRPEALLVVALACVLWGVERLRRRSQWRLLIPAVLLMALPAAAIAFPYVRATGRLTKKKNITDVIPGSSSGRFVQPNPAGEAPRQPTRAEAKLIAQLAEAMHPLLAVCLAIYLVHWLCWRVLRPKWLDGFPLDVRAGPAILMIAAALAISAILIGLYSHAGYLSHRHATFLGVMLCPLAGAGARVAIRWLRLLVRRLRWPAAAERSAATCLVAGLACGLLLHAARSAHPGDSVFRDAGAYIAARISPGEGLLTDNPLVLHYAQQNGTVLSDRDLTGDGVAGRLRRQPAPIVWLVLTDRNLLERPALAEWVRASAPREAISLGNEPQHGVRVFRVDLRTGPAAGPRGDPAGD